MAFEYIWLTDKLKGEYKEAFDKVEIYANVRNIDEVTQNDMLMELLDLFLTAQAEEKPVSKLVGSDLESFCNSFFSSCSMKTYLRSLPQKIYRFCWMILVLELIFYFGSEEEISLLHGTVDVSGYLCGIAVGVFVGLLCNVFIRPFLFRWKWLTSGKFSAFVLLLTFGLIVAGVILLDGYILELPLFPLLLVTGVYIIIYIVARSIWRYRSYGSIRKEKSLMENSGFRQVKEGIKEAVEEMPEELVARFHKKNEKRQKKGKERMTPEEYMEQLHRENVRARKGDYIGPAIVILFVLGLIIQTALTSTLFDTLIFIAVMIAAEIPAMLMFRVGIKSRKRRERIVAECEEQGITILEYVERRKEENHE